MYRLFSTGEHLQVPNGTGSGVRRSERPLLACHTHRKKASINHFKHKLTVISTDRPVPKGQMRGWRTLDPPTFDPCNIFISTCHLRKPFEVWIMIISLSNDQILILISTRLYKIGVKYSDINIDI